MKMTIIEAITAADSLKANLIPQELKIAWLSTLDGRFKAEVIDTHEGGEDIVFSGYGANTPLNVELLIKAPYDAVYVSWLEAKIDYTHNDYQRYANTSEVFDNDYRAAINAYNRAHRSKRIKVKYF
jgi:hypothetical protein